MLGWQGTQRGGHIERGVAVGLPWVVTGGERVQRVRGQPAGGGPGRPPPQQVEAGVNDNPVQPGGDGRIAAEAISPAEGRDHGVLQGVCGVVGVAERAQRHRPQPITVACEQEPERVSIAGHVPPEQVGVGWLVPGGCQLEPRTTML